MIQERIPRLFVTLSIAFPVLCAAQTPAPAPPKSTVYVNPRSGPDDPRIGLKAGLYDAGEAASGLEKLVSLPKPSGFAPGDFIAPPAQPAPEPPPTPGPGRAAQPPSVSYGST